MSWSDFATWLGTFVSLIGAAITIQQARKANTLVTEANNIRNDIVSRFSQNELRDLEKLLSNATVAMDKYGPGASETKRIGSSISKDAAQVRILLAELTRQRDTFENNTSISITKLINDINRALIELGGSTEESMTMARGCEIYLYLTDFSAHLKRAIDKRVFGANVAGPRARAL